MQWYFWCPWSTGCCQSVICHWRKLLTCKGTSGAPVPLVAASLSFATEENFLHAKVLLELLVHWLLPVCRMPLKKTFYMQRYFWSSWSTGRCQSVICHWKLRNPWTITQRWLVVRYRRFGTICRFNFKDHAVQEDLLWLLGHEMGQTACSETLISNHQSVLRQIQKRVDLICTATISWNQTLCWWNISCTWTGICGGQLNISHPPPPPRKVRNPWSRTKKAD